jgi:hypothetical protein
MLKLMNEVDERKTNIRDVFREWNVVKKVGQFNGRILMNIKKGQVELSHRNDDAATHFTISDEDSITGIIEEMDIWVRTHQNIRQWQNMRHMTIRFMQAWGESLRNAREKKPSPFNPAEKAIPIQPSRKSRPHSTCSGAPSWGGRTMAGATTGWPNDEVIALQNIS